ncbi:hypothetical protein [Amycolatopsis thermophila]|uniref:Transposase DDE domain-containing protein n=1 Tax=Amycolatopsis thermophila TaxID=206084 RepID=A0ABU0F1I4_9PSEU|nr:hypothetical protein [Amycolatopsis thermophila]MDQ0381021.1 hypothetical protein [Amycolatopsis thermophila]
MRLVVSRFPLLSDARDVPAVFGPWQMIRTSPDRVRGDTAYSSPAIRGHLRARHHRGDPPSQLTRPGTANAAVVLHAVISWIKALSDTP